MYPPIRINDEQFGCGNRLSAEESARYSVEWDKIRFTPEEFAQRAENMSRLVGDAEEGCTVEADEGVRCRAGSSSFWVTWQGKMMPCGMMTTPVVEPLKIGFDAAWEQIKNQTAQIRTPSQCSGCAYRDVCGVCAAVCLTETGRFDGVPCYICQKTKEQVRLSRELSGERSMT